MKLLLTIFLICIFNIAYTQLPVNKLTRKTEDLVGNVKSVLEKRVMLLDDSSRYIVRNKYAEYDRNGTLVLSKFIMNDKLNKFTSSEFICDSANNVMEVKLYEDSVLSERKLYEYDAQNYFTKELMYKGNGYLFQKSLFFYDVSGHLIEMQLWSSDTYLVLKQFYEYDKNGNRTSLKNYNSSHILTYEYAYQYDLHNNKTEQVYKKLNDPIIQKIHNIYNTNNQLISYTKYNNDKLVEEGNYTYNANGVFLEKMYSFLQKPSKYITRYNEKGLLIETIDYRNDKLTVRQTYWYEYDTTGNWIKRYNSYNGGSPSLTEREIMYY